MPPKISFKKTDVISAGLKIVKESGLNELSARKVAECLNSSTAPIYSYYNSIATLKHDVLLEAQKILIEYSTKLYTEIHFLNMGVGIVLFAREYHQFFRAIFLENTDCKDIISDFLSVMQQEMTKDPMLTSLTLNDQEILLRQMWIFTYGLATMVYMGQIQVNGQDDIIAILDPMGLAAINALQENRMDCLDKFK